MGFRGLGFRDELRSSVGDYLKREVSLSLSPVFAPIKDEMYLKKGLRFIYHIGIHSNKGIRPWLLRVIWSFRPARSTGHTCTLTELGTKSVSTETVGVISCNKMLRWQGFIDNRADMWLEQSSFSTDTSP